VLRSIDEPITLRFYFSSSLGRQAPGLGKYAARVRDLLKEYAANAGGKIHLVEIDPVAFSDAEDEAVGFGLRGLPLDRTGEMVYAGLAGTNSTDEEEIIPFFSPSRETFLEYDLTRTVFRLANPDRTTVGIMSWLPIKGFPGSMMARISAMGRPWQMLAHLGQLFEIKEVATDAAEIPKEVDVLLILHPADLTDKAAYAIDQFMVRGGRALIFVDPLAEVARQTPGAGGKFVSTQSTMKKLFDAWGLGYDDTKVAGDMLSAQRINAGRGGRPIPVEYPAWLRLDAKNIASKDLITGEIDNLIMASAGALSLKAGSKLEFKPLIATSEQSQFLAAEDLKDQPDFVNIVKTFKPSGKSLVLAARLSGKAPSAFAKGPPPLSAYLKKDKGKKGGDKAKPAAKPGEEAEKKAKALRDRLAEAHRAEAAEPMHAIIVADVDMLRDQLWVQVQNLLGQQITIPVSDNMNLATNAIDNLAGSDELIGLRSRGVSRRPFIVVEDLTRAAELRLRAKERELQDRRTETERKLSQLQSPFRGAGQNQGGEGKAILTPKQVKEIEKFKAALLSIPKQLRAVQLGLREDIERLEARLWFTNIGAVPLLVAVVAVGLGFARMRRRRQRIESEARG
jgi:ABC-type uncharacterized transport system involved in gliding motility auxiliary subunit